MFIKNATANGSKDSMQTNKKSNKDKSFNRELNVRFANRKFPFCSKINASVHLLRNSKSAATNIKGCFWYFFSF